MLEPLIKPLFPELITRTGGTPGRAIERVMLSSVGGPQVIRKAVISLPGGSEAIMRAQNGFVSMRVVSMPAPPPP